MLCVVEEDLGIEAWLSAASFGLSSDGFWASEDRRVGVAIHEAGVFVGWCDVEWPHPSSPRTVLRDVRHVIPDEDSAKVAATLHDAVAMARALRGAAVCVCDVCGAECVPGHMHDRRVCQGCAERHLGVVH
jgi:hypothetical protein